MREIRIKLKDRDYLDFAIIVNEAGAFINEFLIIFSMLWKEFKDQAKQDLESCEFLFKEKRDFGNSAYLLQQSLEKYVKAYILKYELFVSQPHEFKHLPAEKMWKILRKEIDRKKKFYKKEIQDLIEKLNPLLEQITEYFLKIRNHNDLRWRNAIWKQSLNLKLEKNEIDILQNFTDEMRRKTIPILSESTSLLSTGKERMKNKTNSVHKRQLEQLIDDTTDLIFQIDLESKDWVDETSSWFTNLEKIIKNMIQMTDSKDKQIVLEQPYMKVLLFAWLFTFRTEMVLVFPHEELGRYPETKDINSRKIYQNEEKNLKVFIEKISICCNRIDEMIIL